MLFIGISKAETCFSTSASAASDLYHKETRWSRPAKCLDERAARGSCLFVIDGQDKLSGSGRCHTRWPRRGERLWCGWPGICGTSRRPGREDQPRIGHQIPWVRILWRSLWRRRWGRIAGGRKGAVPCLQWTDTHSRRRGPGSPRYGR